MGNTKLAYPTSVQYKDILVQPETSFSLDITDRITPQVLKIVFRNVDEAKLLLDYVAKVTKSHNIEEFRTMMQWNKPGMKYIEEQILQEEKSAAGLIFINRLVDQNEVSYRTVCCCLRCGFFTQLAKCCSTGNYWSCCCCEWYYQCGWIFPLPKPQIKRITTNFRNPLREGTSLNQYGTVSDREEPESPKVHPSCATWCCRNICYVSCCCCFWETLREPKDNMECGKCTCGYCELPSCSAKWTPCCSSFCKYEHTICCIDYKMALPTDQDVSFEIACCGISCWESVSRYGIHFAVLFYAVVNSLSFYPLQTEEFGIVNLIYEKMRITGIKAI